MCGVESSHSLESSALFPKYRNRGTLDMLIFLNVPVGEIIRYNYLLVPLRYISNLALRG